MNRRKGVPWTTQATSNPLADFEAIRLLGRKSIGDFEVIINPELENGELIMANTRKPVKPKAGAKPIPAVERNHIDDEINTGYSKAMQDAGFIHTDNLVLDENSDTGYREFKSLGGNGLNTENISDDELYDQYGEPGSDETEDEVSYTPTAEEIAAVLAYIKSQQADETLAEVLAGGIPQHAPSITTTGNHPEAKSLFVPVYDIVADHITGTSIRPEDNGALTLSGRVTDADLDAAGVDKAWLLRIGAIVEAGYAGG